MPVYGTYILLLQLFAAPCIHALGVLLPLNIWPEANCRAWAPATDAISAHPNTQFYLVLNPLDGPGTEAQQGYRACVAALPSSTNQMRLGYVETANGNALADIDAYAGWDSSSRPNGIFLDGVSSNPEGAKGFASHARSKGFTFVALDSGATDIVSYYESFADLVVTYDDPYPAFDPASLTGTLSKQSVMLDSAPSTGSYSSVISRLASRGVAAVYITNESGTSAALPNQLSAFVSEVANVGGGSPPPPPPGGSTSTTGAQPSGSTSTSSKETPSNVGSSSSSPSSKTGSAAPGFTSSGAPNQSGSSRGSLGTSGTAVQAPASLSSSAGAVVTGQSTSTAASHSGSSVAAIVGGLLGALVILLLLLVLFMCMRRRRRAAVNTDANPFTDAEATRPRPRTVTSSWSARPVTFLADPVLPPSRPVSLSLQSDLSPLRSDLLPTQPDLSPRSDVKASASGTRYLSSSTSESDTSASTRPSGTSASPWTRMSAAPAYGANSAQRTSRPPPYSN
ncbi:Spherulation-specific family 4-domain-containing protein [Mycena belliarum]|uniref:Spherulation-specific family 4-domain-containing protein n=1 Tax=Mycena belliarum TaxID=1033014 RepID=A0AAD6U1S8_9AGAR|nr:Spherulation-specific family 4-domain-containing protein [Mycena belliae]